MIEDNKLNIRFGTPASEYSYEPFWEDDFTQGLGKWNVDKLTDGLHLVGNEFLNDDGSVSPEKHQKPKSHRWAAVYHLDRDKTEYIENNQLVQGISVINQINPRRENYQIVHYRDVNGDTRIIAVSENEMLPEHICSESVIKIVDQPYGNHILATSWLSTGMRRFNNDLERHISDFDKSLSLHGPGTYINMRVNYEQMCVRNARHSLWSMPMYRWGDENTPENPAKLVMGDGFPYNELTEDGVENDVIEAVRNPENGHEIISQKLVGGSAKDTPNGTVNHENPDWNDFGIEIFKGWHDIGCLWHPDGHHDYFIDGHQTNHDPRKVWTANYLCLTEELNSGCKKPRPDKDVRYPAGGPRRPRDPGLSGDSCIDDLDKMKDHKIVIDRISLMSVLPKKTQVQGSTVERAVDVELNKEAGFACPNCNHSLKVSV